MSEKPTKGGGFASAFGLALVAMLLLGAIGAGAAQASPVWTVKGKPLVGEASFEGNGGPIEVTNYEFGLPVTIACGTLSSSGHVYAGSEGDATLLLGSCKVNNNKFCKVEPLSLKAHIALSEVGGKVYEAYAPAGAGPFGVWVITGTNCNLKGNWEIWGGFGAEVGPEGTSVSRTYSEAATKAVGWGGLSWFGKWSVSGNASVHLTGANLGYKFGP